MQRIYVLLRNEKQTGPYSLEEIIQFDLKPYDLIWIEGRSAGWYYPQEIGALHPYLSFVPKKQQETTAPKAAVTLPEVSKEKPLPAVPAEPSVRVPKEVFVPLRPATDNLEEKVYNQFKAPQAESVKASTGSTLQTKSSKKPIAVGILSVLVIGGVFAASWIMNRTSGEDVSAAETIAAVPVAEELSSTATDARADQPTATRFTTAQKRTKEKNGVRKTVAQGMPTVQEKRSRETVVTTTTDNSTVYEPAPSSTEEQPAADNKTEETTTEAGAPVEKKKKLRDKILDLFKKKPEEQKSGEAGPDDNGERNSSRREASANLAQMVHLRFVVPNDWMMGIKGAKATLVNRSTQTITKATVEVLYYDDENNLLQKKIVTFSKIDGKGSQTISIPDHSSATKVDYNVISAEGKPAA